MPCWEYDMKKECSPVRHFNAATEPLIPVVFRDGSTKNVSLEEAFRRSDEIWTFGGHIHEIACYLALFMAIAQRSVGIIRNEQEWMRIKSKIVKKSLRYLKKHRREFELFGDKPWYQVPYVSPIKNRNLTRLVPGRATSSISSLHDHETYSLETRHGGYRMPSDEIARVLLCHQPFVPGDRIKTDKSEKWGGAVEHASRGPLYSSFLVMVQGSCLRDTIWMNLVVNDDQFKLTAKNMGKPFWEIDFKKPSLVQKYVSTYFGWILPFPRAIRVHDSIIASLNGAGRYDEVEYRHPFLTRVVNQKNPDGFYQKVNRETFVWRALPASLVAADSNRLSSDHPWALRRAERYDGTVRIMAGGLVFAKTHALAPCESEFYVRNKKVNGKMTGLADWRTHYAECLKLADKYAGCLEAGAKTYMKETDSYTNCAKSTRKRFWWSLTLNQHVLLEAAESGCIEAWDGLCRKEMEKSFKGVLGAVSRGGEMRAFARSINVMMAKAAGVKKTDGTGKES